MAYPGGKGGAFQHLINRIPPHRVYVESHFGGGAVFHRKRPAAHSVVIDLDPRVLQGFETRSDFTAICGDAVEVLPTLGLTRQDFLYCDPPYLRSTRKGGRLYLHDGDDEHHNRLLSTIKEIPCRVMVSGYANPIYQEALSEWRTESFSVASRTGKRTETVWMNYHLDALHDTRFIGKSFREREQFRRKRARWQNQFSRLPQIQQQAIFEDFESHFRALSERELGSLPRLPLEAIQLSLPGFAPLNFTKVRG